MNKRVKNIILFFFILSLPALLYLNTMSAPPLWEDGPLVLDNRLIRNAGNLFTLFRPGFWSSYHIASIKDYRPVSFSTFIIDNTLFGGSVKTYRAGNILLYTLAVLLLYILVNLLSSSRRVAIAAALLFSAQPVHVEAVVWIKNRSELLAALLMLISLAAFTKMCLSPGRRAVLFTSSLLACFLALLSKESALILPFILCAILLFLRREGRTGVKAGVLAPYLISSAAFYIFKQLAIPRGRAGDALSYLPSPHSHAAIAIKTIGGYLRLLLLPTNLSIQHVSPSMGLAMDRDFLISLTMLFIFAMAIIASFRLNKLTATALIWTAICLLPVSNIFFMLPGRPIAEQRLLFPSAGLSIALASILFSGRDARSRWIILAVIVTCYCALTINRNRDWSDSRRLMERTLSASSGSWKAGFDLASMSFDDGDYAGAFRYARMAATLYPNLTEPYHQIAAFYGKLGHLKKAEGYYKLALKINPDDCLVHNGLGSIYSKSGKYALARKEYRLALRHWPQPAPILVNIGLTYERDGNPEEAGRFYREAIKSYPDYKGAYCDLGRVLYKTGRMDASRSAFAEALDIDGRYSPAHRGLGEIELAEGRHNKARVHFERALDLSAENAEVLNSIAISHKKEGDLRAAFTCYRRALLSDPLKSSYLDSLMDTYRMIGDPCLKVELCDVIRGASQRCLDSGHRGTARTYLETLLRIDRGNTEAREMMMNPIGTAGADHLSR